MRRRSMLVTLLSGLYLSFPAHAGPPPKPTPELLARGKAAFATNCASCHGEKGAGDGAAAKYMSPKPRSFVEGKFKQGSTPPQVFKTITEGLPGSSMASFATLPENDRWGLAYYVLSLKGDRK